MLQRQVIEDMYLTGTMDNQIEWREPKGQRMQISRAEANAFRR